MLTFRSPPHIVSCNDLFGIPTRASLTHHEIFEAIIMIRNHPKDINKTLLEIHSDKKPFDIKHKVIIDLGSSEKIVSIDRRSEQE